MSALTSVAPALRDQAARLRALMQAAGVADAEPASVPAPRRAPLVAIASGKGGVGKTTAAVNLSIALAELGLRVTLVDADLGMANADILCGLTPTRRLEDALTHAATAQEAARVLDAIALDAPGGFRLIPGSAGIRRMASLAPLERAALLDAIANLPNAGDLVIVDTGAGMSPGITSLVESADVAVIVATPEPTSIADAYALIKCVAPNMRRDASTDDVRIRLLVNAASSFHEAEGVQLRIDAVARRFLGIGVPLLAWVSDDASVRRAVRARTPVLLASPRSDAARDLRRGAASLAQALRLQTACRPQGAGMLVRLLRRSRVEPARS